MDKTNLHIPFERYAFLRAEAVMAELLSNGITEEELMVHYESGFKKLFRSDVDQIRLSHNSEAPEKSTIDVHINRDSIYDLLPEGLFHQPLAATQGSNLSNMVADSRRLKKEEKAARLFFAPLDQQMILFSTLAERVERVQSRRISAGNITDDPYAFWGIPAAVLPATATVLSAIMPWVYLIKGNLQLIVKAFEMILQKSVSVTTIDQQIERCTMKPKAIEQLCLGEDAVLGERYYNDVRSWVFTIHHISDTEMVDYVPNGSMNRLISYVSDILLPVEIEVRFEYEIEEKRDTVSRPILGYGFVI